jgi:CARDB protein
MKSLRLALTIALAVAVGGAAAVAGPAAATARAAVAPATAGPSPRAQLGQFTCQRGLNPADRAVSVQAVMRPLTGTRRLAVKFELLQRAAGTSPESVVRAGDLGVWITPTNPTLGQVPGDVWRLTKAVINLDAPAGYQFKVLFRWIGAHARVIGTAVRFSRSCQQPELRPDLQVRSITVSPLSGRPSRYLYTAVIADAGATGAGPFEVLFTPGDSSPAAIRTVSFLAARSSVQVSFTGPSCNAASPPTVTADAAHEVDDDNRANNVMSVVCPAAPAPVSQ